MAVENDKALTSYIAHNEALREADVRFHEERDKRYFEIDKANKAAVAVAAATANKAAEKIEQALSEYKAGANEWRKTVSDLIALQQGGSKGMRDMSSWAFSAIMIILTIFNIFYK